MLDLGSTLTDVERTVGKTLKKSSRGSKLSPQLIAEAMTRRIVQRGAATGVIKLPAVPSLVDYYVKTSAEVFAGSGRGLFPDEKESLERHIAHKLELAFAASPRSKIEIAFEAEPGRALGYTVTEHIRSVADAYQRWIGTTEGPLFGAHADARVLAAAQRLGNPATCRVLDFGAGTGRNALTLARLGHPVDAVEITPEFAQILTATAIDAELDLRVIVDDVFRNRSALACDYALVIASEVVPDFRGISELRQLFELGRDVLRDGGWLLFNVHLCRPGYNPDRAARELSQQCYSSLFTPNELAEAAAGLPFSLIANDSVHDFEREHLPPNAFPPTPWYVNWISGLDVYEIEPEQCPVELRWLVFEKGTSDVSAGGSPRLDSALGTAMRARDPARRVDAVALRQALTSRLSRRQTASGTLTLPALPACLDIYAALCRHLFSALGHKLGTEQSNGFRDHLGQMLTEAFARSQRSNVVITYEAPAGTDLKYTVSCDPFPVAEAYESIHDALGDDAFGLHSDARLRTLVEEMGAGGISPVLDVGAGTGRNAGYLARLGISVDAVEISHKFAQALEKRAQSEQLPLRVIARDIFECADLLRHDYRLVLLSGTVGDFRGVVQFRQMLELAAAVLAVGGALLLNAHIAVEGYRPDVAVRQWAEQNSATCFTSDELAQLVADLPFALRSSEPAFDYEQAHLPSEQWPPTPGFPEWATGVHMYDLGRIHSPIELRWLVFERIGDASCRVADRLEGLLTARSV